jgi:fructokinase
MTPDVLVAGECLVDFIPAAPGPLADVERFDRRAGGAPANVAVGLARLGETPWLCTALSTDPFGDFLAETLADEGLPDRFVSRVDRPTALAFVTHDPDADRGFTFYREDTADTRLDTGAVGDDTLADVGTVVVGGVPLSVEPSRTATFDLVERARAAGCRVVFDPNTRPELWSGGEDLPATLERMLGLTDVLKASREDFGPTGFPTGEGLAGRVLEAGPDTVLLTEGSAGATAVAGPGSPWGDDEWHHAGHEVEDVVDTTGAGDAFLAGAVAALADGEGPEETLAFANAAAAVATTTAGAMAALPDRGAIERFRGRSA